MKSNKIIFYLLIVIILSIMFSINVVAASKQFTITVKDTDGNYLSGIRVSMRNDYSLSSQVELTTDSNGGATFTMYDNKTYGFNVYDTNHNDMCI